MGEEQRYHEPYSVERRPDDFIRVLSLNFPEIVDSSTGNKRTFRTSLGRPIKLESGGSTILFCSSRQQDFIPSLGLVRTVEKRLYVPDDLEERIEIKKITELGNGSVDTVEIIRDNSSDSVRLELHKDGIKYNAIYNIHGRISEISIETDDPKLAKGNKELEEGLDIILKKEGASYFEVFDLASGKIRNEGDINFMELGSSVWLEHNMRVSQEIGVKGFCCKVLDCQGRFVVPVKFNKSEKETRIFAEKFIDDADKLYASLSTESFADWEKVLQKMNDYFFIV